MSHDQIPDPAEPSGADDSAVEAALVARLDQLCAERDDMARQVADAIWDAPDDVAAERWARLDERVRPYVAAAIVRRWSTEADTHEQAPSDVDEDLL